MRTSQFERLEREIIEATVRRTLDIIDKGMVLGFGDDGLARIDGKLAARLRDVRDELKRLRDVRPVVRQRRVVRDPHGEGNDYEWTIPDGAQHPVLLYKGVPSDWENMAPTRERVALWADLLANPLEDVEGGE